MQTTLKHTPCDCSEYRRLTEACADLLRERDALAKDAERYRWLRDKGDKFAMSLCDRWMMDARRVDQVIDECMQETTNA